MWFCRTNGILRNHMKPTVAGIGSSNRICTLSRRADSHHVLSTVSNLAGNKRINATVNKIHWVPGHHELWFMRSDTSASNKKVLKGKNI